jgi:lipopolysaccharide heptosyltransferase I
VSAKAANVPPNSLLVVRLGAMGDVIHTLAAVCSLRNAFPNMNIGWIIEDRWSELLCVRSAPLSGPRSPQRPVADFVHIVDTKRWRKSLFYRQTKREARQALREVRDRHYEIAADFQGALKSAVIARMSGANAIFGFANPREWPARMFYRYKVTARGAHVIEQYHSLAEAVAGKPLIQSATIFPRDENAEASIATKISGLSENLVIINPGAGWGAKRWPAERYGEVARQLSLCGFAPLINFGPGEEDLALQVQATSNGVAQPISCSISELIALTRRARLFVGADTGPLHLAAALQVPVVAIFGPTDPARNGPYGAKSVVLRNPASKTSLSHTSAPDPGLLAISAVEVVSAARELLRSAIA